MIEQSQGNPEDERTLLREYSAYSPEIRHLADRIIAIDADAEAQGRYFEHQDAPSAEYNSLAAELKQILDQEKQKRVREFEAESTDWSERKRVKKAIEIEVRYAYDVAIGVAAQNRRSQITGAGRRITRRGFLKNALGALAISWAALDGAPQLWIRGQDYFNESELDKDINTLRKHIHDRYGIYCGSRITTTDRLIHRQWGVRASQLLSKYVELKALHIIRRVLAQYPPEFIRLVVRSITVTGTLELGDKNVHGTFLRGGSILVNRQTSGEAVYLNAIHEATLHHEIGHAATLPFQALRREWTRVQDPSKYRGEDWVEAESRPDGFASSYGTKSLPEDMATVAGGLMTETRSIFRRSRTDPMLKQKIGMIMDVYEQISRVGMKRNAIDTAYWNQRLSGSKIDESYWD